MSRRFYISVAGLTVEMHPICQHIQALYKDYEIKQPELPADIIAIATEEKIQAELAIAKGETLIYTAEECCLFREIAEQAPLLGRFLMHGAAISYGGKGYFFGALSGTGKSTHIALWKKYLGDDVGIINGDKPLMHVSDHQINVCATPWAGKERWHQNVSYPLGAICLIQRGKTNHIQRIAPNKYLNLLLQQVYLPKNPAARMATLDLLEQVLTRVPVYLLQCDISEDAVKTAFSAMTGLEYKASETEGCRPWNALWRQHMEERENEEFNTRV